MLYNDNVCSLEDVTTELEQSIVFGWSWSREKREPYRHTAIALYFNKTPSFTINFRPEEGFGKFEAAFSECGSSITIERVYNPYENSVEYFPPFDEFEIDSGRSKRRALEIIKLVLYYDPGRYNLITNNCRNHVEGVKKHVENHKHELNANVYRDDMTGTKNGDVYRFFGAAFTAFAAVGGVVVAGAAIASSVLGSDKEDDDRETQKLKA